MVDQQGDKQNVEGSRPGIPALLSPISPWRRKHHVEIQARRTPEEPGRSKSKRRCCDCHAQWHRQRLPSKKDHTCHTIYCSCYGDSHNSSPSSSLRIVTAPQRGLPLYDSPSHPQIERRTMLAWDSENLPVPCRRQEWNRCRSP